MATLPSEIAELVRSRAGGNPFFAEELMYALRDSGLVTIEGTGDETRCIINGDLNQAAHTLPETIEGIILSRIDRLPPEQQLTLKIAAVIGRTFAFPALHTMLHAQMDITDRMLKNYLDDLVHLDLTPLEAPEPELTYIFKHIITQEVAYETLLYAQRRELHGAVATWYEQQFSTNEGTEAHQDTPDSPLAPYYPLLVYHWGRADEPEQERRYALLAGHWAAAQFANEEAVSYFTRAIELTAEEDFDSHYELLLAREVVNDLLGDREAQSGDLDSIHLLIKNSTDQRKKAELALRQANYFEVTSDYPEALRSAKEAINYANQINDIAVEAEGYIVLGKSLWRQGEYAAAHQPLEHSLGLSKQAGTIEYRAKGLYYLGHIHLYQGDYTNSQTYYSQALNLFQSIHHYPGEADSLSMLGVIRSELGDYLAASDYSEQAITICQTIGDLRGEVIILGNLGNVYWLLGDYKTAQDYQQRTYEINLIINDSWGEAFSLTNLALIHYSLSEYEKARKKSEQALEIQKRIGDRSGQGYSLTYLGLALTGIKQYEVAIQANNDAIAIRKDLGQNSLTVDNTACLAEIALATNNGTEAQAYANEILKWFDEHGADGVEFPLQAQLTCYEVLTKTNYSDTQDVPQAKKLLDQAYHTLMEQADNISDHAIRDGFLNNDKTNRTLTEAWQARNASN
ncbi:MAG: tetratricopeptide repeat protein [Chloroflexota bacterium]